jgi:hypothetical protein
VLAAGQQAPAPGGVMGVVANPRLITTGGGDVLILDSSNSLWAWHPATGNASGRGVLKKVNMRIPAVYMGIPAIGTSAVDQAPGQYEFYLADPDYWQIVEYPPAPDGSGYPAAGRADYLRVSQDVSKVTDMYIDGDVYLADGGHIEKYRLGSPVDGWALAKSPFGADIPRYTLLTSDNPAPDQGNLYAYDALNQRIVEFAKTDGAFVAQYVADPLGSQSLSMAAGMFVKTDAGGANPKIYWTLGEFLLSASLEPSVAESSPSAAEPSGSVAVPFASNFAAPTTTSGALPTPILPSWTSGPGWFAYKVLPGDTMSAIATKFNLPLWQLELANPQVTDFNSLLIGQLLNIPPPGQGTQPPTTSVPW